MKALTLAGLVCAAVCGCTQSPHEKALAECRENYPIDGPQSTWDWKTCPYGREEYDGCDDEDPEYNGRRVFALFNSCATSSNTFVLRGLRGCRGIDPPQPALPQES